MVEVDILGMRYLGVDYGTKRMGIAVSDDGGRIAFPKSVISLRGLPSRFREVRRIAREENVGAVVIGLPADMFGKERETAGAVRVFGERLTKALSLPVIFENELLTTRLASKSASRGKDVDASAAALILQSYLDRKFEVPNHKSQTNSND